MIEIIKITQTNHQYNQDLLTTKHPTGLDASLLPLSGSTLNGQVGLLLFSFFFSSYFSVFSFILLSLLVYTSDILMLLLGDEV